MLLDVPVLNVEPEVDEKLSDSVWSRAARVDSFFQLSMGHIWTDEHHRAFHRREFRPQDILSHRGQQPASNRRKLDQGRPKADEIPGAVGGRGVERRSPVGHARRRRLLIGRISYALQRRAAPGLVRARFGDSTWCGSSGAKSTANGCAPTEAATALTISAFSYSTERTDTCSS